MVRIKCMLILFLTMSVSAVFAQGDGYLTKDGRRLFPIGIYEMPRTDAELKAMADGGINLVRCGSREDLDRVHRFGMQGWMPLSVQQGATPELRQKIESVVGHPALAVWEGPDEIVWNFTAYSGLYRDAKVYSQQGEWWLQTPLVINYSEERGKEIIPKLREGIKLVRELDDRNRQFWINEARDSDLKFMRQYMDVIDITGADYYPINTETRDAFALGWSTNRFLEIGRGKPVYMVLQAFSWHELGGRYGDRGIAYPSFDESRLMAYACIARGARGVMYWGSMFLKNDEFRTSLYALTSELSQLHLFLTAPDETAVEVKAIEGRGEQPHPSEHPKEDVTCTARRSGRDWLIILVNETDFLQYGVEVNGLKDLNGMEFGLLYGDETVTIRDGELITRLKPHEVKVFATSDTWESPQREGRDYKGQ